MKINWDLTIFARISIKHYHILSVCMVNTTSKLSIDVSSYRQHIELAKYKIRTIISISICNPSIISPTSYRIFQLQSHISFHSLLENKQILAPISPGALKRANIVHYQILYFTHVCAILLQSYSSILSFFKSISQRATKLTNHFQCNYFLLNQREEKKCQHRSRSALKPMYETKQYLNAFASLAMLMKKQIGKYLIGETVINFSRVDFLSRQQHLIAHFAIFSSFFHRQASKRNAFQLVIMDIKIFKLS